MIPGPLPVPCVSSLVQLGAQNCDHLPPPTHTFLKRRFPTDFEKHTHTPPKVTTFWCITPKVEKSLKKCENAPCWHEPDVPERYLEELGVDVAKVVNRLPAVSGYSMENMKGTVAYLEELGVDVAKVVNRGPTVFGLTMENVKGTIAYLEELGVDVAKVVNMHPPMFGYNVEKNLHPKVVFLTQQMGRSTSEIESFPSFLSYSLHSRIDPRYRYLQHVDHNTGCSLSYMLTPGDEKFARVVAGTSLEEYMTWRSKELDISSVS